MWGQRLNRPLGNRKSFVPRRPAATLSGPVRDGQTGFIQHATGTPLQYRRLRPGGRRPQDRTQNTGEIGLMFQTDEYIRPGSMLEISIPLRDEVARFRGRVVLVKTNADHYEIGVWMNRAADASRMRIVEQICHIESYLQQRKFQDGPYNLNRERLAAEWIAENADSVPTLQPQAESG